jgi:hypothetical protein
MIVRTMAALGPRVASASHHLAPAGKPPSVTPPTIIRSPRRSTSASAPTSATTGENGAAPAEIRAPRVEGREVSVEAASWSPRRRTAQVGGDRTQDEPAPVRRTESRARELAPAFVRPPAPRASLAARRASPALGRTHGAALSGDDGWPSLPPIFLPPPPEVEAPAPRLHRLARDQEEGLWSA